MGNVFIGRIGTKEIPSRRIMYKNKPAWVVKMSHLSGELGNYRC